MLPDLDVPAIKQFTIEELFIRSIKLFVPKFSKNIETIQDETVEKCYKNDKYIDNFLKFKNEKTKEIFDVESITFLDFEFLTREEIERTAFAQGISLIEKANILDSQIKERIMLKKLDIINYICQNRNDDDIKNEVIKYFSLKSKAILEDELFDKFLVFCGKFKGVFAKRVKSQTPNKLFLEFTGKQPKNMNINDLACYLLILATINKTDIIDDIRHVVIDEAQDFSIATYYTLKTIFPKATFSVVGDIMQNIHVGGLESWDILKNKIFNERTEYASLIKSYRNTIEISKFAQDTVFRLIGKKIEIEPIIRHGDEVLIHPYVTPPERVQTLIEVLESFNQKGFHMNAIICKTECEAEKLYNVLSKKTSDVMLLNPENGKLEQGNYIVSLPNAKGLEFDCVAVWDYDSYSKKDVNSLYVALTRALHKLDVFSNKKF